MLIITVYVLKELPSALTGIYLLSHCAALSPCSFSFTSNVSKIFCPWAKNFLRCILNSLKRVMQQGSVCTIKQQELVHLKNGCVTRPNLISCWPESTVAYFSNAVS